MKPMIAPVASHMTFAQALRAFGSQVENKTVKGQRPHKARTAAGKANHIRKVALTQAVLHAVERRVRGRKVALDLVDGNHRMTKWIADGDCPFEKLLLVTYVVDGDTDEEALDLANALMRTLDSSNASKTASDFYTAAVVDAGIEATSQAYKVGLRAATFFRRTIGPAKSMTDRQLTEAVASELTLHRLMDKVFTHSENRSRMSDKQAHAYFNPAVAIALFQFLENRGRIPMRVAVLFTDALAIACRDKSVTPTACAAESVALGKTLRMYCNEDNFERIRSTMNVEGFYQTLAAQLATGLRVLDTVVPKKRKVA
jgi:hypothetical protein